MAKEEFLRSLWCKTLGQDLWDRTRGQEELHWAREEWPMIFSQVREGVRERQSLQGILETRFPGL